MMMMVLLDDNSNSNTKMGTPEKLQRRLIFKLSVIHKNKALSMGHPAAVIDNARGNAQSWNCWR
jgi:hypothetical protein